MQSEKCKVKSENRSRTVRRFRGLGLQLFTFHFSLCTVGCLGITGNGSRAPAPPSAPRIDQTPTAADLLGYLNRTAAKVQSLEARDLDIDITAGRQSVGVSGALFCQQPRNFRMRAKTIGKDVADIGSNDQEFWFWVSEDNPPDLRHCSYADLAGGVRLPFPVQPEWVMEVLGLARRDVARADQCRVEVKPDAFELIEQVTAANGERVLKVTVFNRRNETGTEPTVKALRLYDAAGRTLIAQATVTSVKRDPRDPVHGYAVPHKVEMSWPAQQLKLKLTLDGLALNQSTSDAAANPVLYTRPVLKNIRSYDLARGTYDAPPAAIQRTGARFR
jgi:hypothetical protein